MKTIAKYSGPLLILTLGFTPSTLLATRGAEDYGILMAVFFLFYSLPIGALLLAFIIYSIILLNDNRKDKKGRGLIVFILSLILILPTIVLPLAVMNWTDWNNKAVELMIGVFSPVLALAIISVVLAYFVRKRSLLADIGDVENDLQEQKYTKPLTNKTARNVVLVVVLLVVAFLIFLFRFYFMGR